MLVGCGSDESDDRSLNDFISAYQSADVEVDPNEKPIFALIGATDGVIFYMDNKKVAIYEYESVKAKEDAIKNDNRLEQFTPNGKFLLETSHEEAIQIFESVN